MADAAAWAAAKMERWAALAEEVRRRLGAGVPLEAVPRAFYAVRLGRDVSGAALHRGPFAEALAESLGAAALAVPGHVAGGAAALDPTTPAGTALLGHELEHATGSVQPLPLAPEARLPVPPARTAPVAAAPAAPGGNAGQPPSLEPAVQRVEQGEQGGEAAALAVERSLLAEALAGAQPPEPVDVEALAERVYRRLRDSLQLERERAPWGH
jgi:hypothetical protein